MELFREVLKKVWSPKVMVIRYLVITPIIILLILVYSR